ncbi:MAG: hypothetical protein ACRD2P_17705 [Terriglobia bacterium]
MLTRKVSHFGQVWPVADPGPTEMEEPEPKPEPEPQTSAVGFLSALLNAASAPESMQSERLALLNEAVQLGARVDAFLDALKAAHRTELEKQLEATKKRGREQAAVVEARKVETLAAENRLSSASAEHQKAILELNAEKNNPPAWLAPRSEVKKWEEKKSELTDRLRDANAEVNSALEQVNESRRILEVEWQRFEDIKRSAERLEGELSGKAFYDPELRLAVSASQP